MDPLSLVGRRFVHVMDHKEVEDEGDLNFTVATFMFSADRVRMYKVALGPFIDQSDQVLISMEEDALIDMLSESVCG